MKHSWHKEHFECSETRIPGGPTGCKETGTGSTICPAMHTCRYGQSLQLNQEGMLTGWQAGTSNAWHLPQDRVRQIRQLTARGQPQHPHMHRVCWYR
jgi:hypothetical protein